MTTTNTRICCAVALVLGLGCVGGATIDTGASARFDLAAVPLALDAAPFPADFRRADDGTIAIGALPSLRGENAMFTRLRALLGARRGFCATCTIYFPIEGVLDRESVPDATSGAASDAVVLVDVDPSSPELGRFIPLELEWNEALGLVAARPARGIALHGSRTYAAALTSDLRAGDGSPLDADPRFEAHRDDLTAGMIEAGVDASRIVVATVFTTEDVTADLRGARAAVYGAPLPAIEVDRVWHAGAELDGLLGVPSEDRPGIEVVPLAGTEGTRAIRHATVAMVIAGRLRAPRLVTGTGVEVGELSRDADGAIAAGPLEDVPFILSVPSGATVDLAQLPIVVHHHGFNASRTTGFAIAETAARAGYAVISIDAYQHGERAASAHDDAHALRGDGVAGADGFAETSLIDVSARVFGLSGVTRGTELYPGYPLAAFVQFVADVVATIRCVADGDLAPLRAADPALATLAFDVDRVVYVGNSMGAVIGTSVVVIEPRIRAAALNVPPGAIIDNLVQSPEFRPLTTGTLLPQLGVAARDFDEVDRHLAMDPIVELVRWTLEPIDPLALARHLFTERVPEGATPDVLFQPAVLDEVAWPVATESFLDAAGATHVTRYEPAGHGMLEVLDQVSVWEPPYEPPLARRATALPVVNPIGAVHDEIEAFLRGTGAD